MRSRTAEWFICKIIYEKTMEDGLQKKVMESYVVDAISFTEAEARITEKMKAYISGEFTVQEIDRCKFKEIFFDDKDFSDFWYKAKVNFISIDGKTEKEKKTAVYYLVQANSVEEANKNIDIFMGGSMIDYVISGVNETKILDVYEYKLEPETYETK